MPAYKLVDSQDRAQWDVELTDGDYQGCIFRVNYVAFEEREADGVHLRFDYDIVNGYEYNDKQQFENTIASTIFTLLEDSLLHEQAKKNLEI